MDLDVAARLRQAGLRVTALRLAVFAAVAEHPHSDADDVTIAVRARLFFWGFYPAYQPSSEAATS